MEQRPSHAYYLELALKRVESYLVWRRLWGISGKQNNRIFLAMANFLRENLAQNPSLDRLPDLVERYLLNSEGEDRWPVENELRHGIQSQRAYWPGRPAWSRVTRYILCQIEGNLRENGAPRLDDMTLEHIMPRENTDDWQEACGNEYLDMYQRVDNLANLTLLPAGAQGQAGSMTFNRKKAVYQNSEIEMTQRLCNYSGWGIEQLQSRAHELANIVETVWPRPSAPEKDRAS
jgi:hypothetical protein